MNKKALCLTKMSEELARSFEKEIKGLVEKKKYMVENSTVNHGKTLGVVVEYAIGEKSETKIFLYYDISRSKMKTLTKRPKSMKKLDFSSDGILQYKDLLITVAPEKVKQTA